MQPQHLFAVNEPNHRAPAAFQETWVDNNGVWHPVVGVVVVGVVVVALLCLLLWLFVCFMSLCVCLLVLIASSVSSSLSSLILLVVLPPLALCLSKIYANVCVKQSQHTQNNYFENKQHHELKKTKTNNQHRNKQRQPRPTDPSTRPNRPIIIERAILPNTQR